MKQTIYAATLIDQAEGPPFRTTLAVKILDDRGCLRLQPEGYSECCAADGEGYPIALDYFDGKLKLFVWADINQEDPTHVIDLAGAAESQRREE